ncbi:MAG: stage V sporulation protein SpoVM [Oscillospiraceae bacterium]|nr:stage V sporulation protein SpoVM [Oscillospiraceae bacterium]
MKIMTFKPPRAVAAILRAILRVKRS